MDIATRFQPRVRAQSYLDRERNAMPHDNDSGGESETLSRRKFQRTAPDADTSNTFRKPSIPASATRQAKLEHGPSVSQRRKSTLRENVRVPSGPREFPSPGKRVASTSSTLAPSPSANEPNNAQRTFLPHVNSEPFFANSRLLASGDAEQGTRFSFGGNNNPQHPSTDEPCSPTSPAERASGGFDFVPTMNFDDFQSSLADPNWTSPMLSEFPNVSGGRVLPKEPQAEQGNMMARSNGFASGFTRPGGSKQDKVAADEEKGGVSRTPSFRKRLSMAPGSRNASGQTAAITGQAQANASQPNLSLRTRRQSTMPQSSTVPSLPAIGGGNRPPRKSVGPGLITNLMGDRKGITHGQTPTTPADSASLARNSSLSKARRTTLQPSASAGAELPRMSTLTATTQSRANKVKSMQPPPRTTSDPDTPTTRTAGTKGDKNRAHTPSSSGGRRQSAVSGRASGLGARTISPTDARRLKRMSMAAPPMPTALPKGPPTPKEEAPDPFVLPGGYTGGHNAGQPTGYTGVHSTVRPELPRLTQPSPSLIPRKTSSTPISARESPERHGFPSLGPPPPGLPVGHSLPHLGAGSLSSKSSYQSLLSNSNSTSRLPTPKPRGVHSSSAQYAEERELVPPVPAIPKAYESPKECEIPFFSSSYNSTKSGLSGGEQGQSFADFDAKGAMLPPPSAPPVMTGPTSRTSIDIATGAETPGKRSGEYGRQHKRVSTFGKGELGSVTSGASTAVPRTPASRAHPDATGRRNNNLQPLRLPPLNLMPLNAPKVSEKVGLPRPTQEIESRDNNEHYTSTYMSSQTPEPRRSAKTPSTPMTASKATFWRRKEEESKGLRASTSHYALRDVMQMDDTATRFYDDSSDAETAGGVRMSAMGGVPIPSQKRLGRGITPFASGSLPKGGGEEFARLRGRPSGEYQDDYDLGAYDNLNLQSAKPQGPRPKTSGVISVSASQHVSGKKEGTPSSMDRSPMTEQAPQLPEVQQQKKESAGGGLRRKLSLGWRRSSSKAANHLENKSSPQSAQHLETFETLQRERSAEKEKKEYQAKLQKRVSEMPPPKLPASASTTWLASGETGVPTSLPASARGSLDGLRRKSGVGGMQLNGSNVNLHADGEVYAASAGGGGGVKTRALHSEQPQPVSSSAAQRASSWGNFASNLRGDKGAGVSAGGGPIGKPSVVAARHKMTASTLSAIVKDKDDLAADEEMRRLSQKRKDVDTAARESEALKARAVARSPMLPEQVLRDRTCGLNIFERGEIMDYEKDGIYFTGTRNAKKIIGSLSPSPTGSSSKEDSSKAGNYGYDDERGDYNIVLGDHLAYRYEVVDVLGKGSFGQVVRCVDHKEGGVVAVKIIRNKKRFHQQALVEVGILGRLGEWDPDGANATLSITTSFYFRNHLCIVTPCLSINLYEFIRAHNFNGFSLPLIRRFSRQLLACLVLLQTKRIIHCDLKPENILLCEARKADVRVIDFGSSCREEEKVYTYIQSRFYRSPEVILGSSYGLGIDMWSFGCILAELWTGYPLFPGENEQEQLACIMEIFGPPDRHLVERCTRKKLFFDSVGKPRVTVSSKGKRRRPSSKTLQQALKTEDEAFVDFIARCLRWDPERRLKPAEAVSHSFIMNLPFHQRAGIPEEARRAARVRSSAAVPANGVVPASPVKRVVTRDGNAFAQPQQQANATPSKDRGRALPETPQTAVRNGTAAVNAAGFGAAQGSPSKLAGNRRHSTVASAGGAAAVAGSKRASNGAVLSGGMATQQRVGSGAPGNLAAMAARESMGGASAQNTARWRT